MKRPSQKGKVRKRRGSPSVRLPLPKKGEARHGDLTKYDRARAKQRLRGETRPPERTE